MVGLARLICNPTKGKKDGSERKVFDVPREEAANLKHRLQKAGWEVTIEYI